MSKSSSSGSKLSREAYRKQQDREIEKAFNESLKGRSNVRSSTSVTKEENMLFFLVGMLVSTIPFLTYAIPMYDAGGPLDKTALFIYIINILASGLVLFATYHTNCAQSLKRSLDIAGSDIRGSPDKLKTFEAKIRNRAVNFSFFSVNLVFMLAYLFFNFLFHGYLQDDVWTFIVVTDLAALLAFFPISVGLYQKLEKFI